MIKMVYVSYRSKKSRTIGHVGLRHIHFRPFHVDDKTSNSNNVRSESLSNTQYLNQHQVIVDT